MRLSDQAYQLLRQRIITLELPPLSPLDEQTLSQDLHLGRTPIREALQRLAADGLVFHAPRRGPFVSEISITDLQKIFEARIVMEGLCARLAAQRVTPAQLSKMDALMQELSSTPSGDNRTLMTIDERYHRLLYESADNEFLAGALGRLHALSFRLWYLVLDRMSDVSDAMQQHIEITRALKAGDEVRAEELLRDHISQFHWRISDAIYVRRRRPAVDG